MSIESIITTDKNDNIIYGASIALNSIMDHFYKKE